MNASDAMAWLAGGVVVLACVAGSSAWLVRRSGVPGRRIGAGVVGGILAGVLLGPGVAGRAVPGAFERAYLGGVSERRALEGMEARHERELRVVEATGVTPEYLVELRAEQSAERAPLARAAVEARARRRAAMDGVAATVVAAHLVLVGLVAGPLGRRSRRVFRDGGDDDRRRALSVGDAAGAGGLMVVVALVAPILVMMWILRAPVGAALGVALAMGAPALGGEIPWRLLPGAAIGVVVSVAVVAGLVWGTDAAVAGAIAGAGALVMVGLAVSGAVRVGRRLRRAIGWILVGATLPLVAALAALRCDPHALWGSLEFWVVGVTAVLLSSDGRWLGVAWAQRLFPRGTGRALPGARTWSAASGAVNAGTGMAQLALAMVLEAGGVIAPPALAGLVLGAAAIELTRGVRTRVSRLMDGEVRDGEGEG